VKADSNSPSALCPVPVSVTVSALGPLPSLAEVCAETALPNSTEGSDHLPLRAEVEVRY
jgi:hypothetical protein